MLFIFSKSSPTGRTGVILNCRVGRKDKTGRLELRRDVQKAKSKELIAELKPQIVEQVKAAKNRITFRP